MVVCQQNVTCIRNDRLRVYMRLSCVYVCVCVCVGSNIQYVPLMINYTHRTPHFGSELVIDNNAEGGVICRHGNDIPSTRHVLHPPL